MDIFADLNTAILTRLNTDSVLSAGVPALVIAEDPLVSAIGDEVTPEAHRAAVSGQMNTAGIVGLLSVPDLDRVEGDRFILKGTLAWYENKTQNKASAGAQKVIQNVVGRSVALLHRFTPQVYNQAVPPVLVNPYSMLLVSRAEFIGEEKGVGVWGIEFETKFAIGLVP